MRATRLATAVTRIQHLLKGQHWENWGVAGVVLLAALATGFDLPWVQMLERQTQALFFELRGPVPTPANIVILTIDDNALRLASEYQRAGIDRPYLSLIQTWPWQRQTYALVIDRLLQAGARSVSLDLLLTTPSLYGPQDDRALAAVLARQGDQVVLAAQYASQENQTGSIDRLLAPLPQFEALAEIGTINYPIEANGRIHQFGSQFVNEQLRRLPPAQAVAFQALARGIPTFAEATLQAAQLSYPTPAGSNLFFYGPASAFDQVAFLDVLDPDTWQKQFQSGAYFRDKIVLVGSTALAHQDFHATPFANSWLFPEKMPGIVINATAIATLLQGRAIADAIPPAPLRGLAVLIVTAGATWVLTRPRSLLGRWGLAVGLGSSWLVLGYVTLVRGNLILPIAIPAGTIFLGGLVELVVGAAQEQRRKQQLRDTLKHYATSPIVQEIISQQEDLQDLLQARQQALAGTFLSNRYKIVRVLGSGGFGETYVAEDTQRPGHPQCVVKQLKVVTDSPKVLELARRLFRAEADALERLGQHPQVPQLLAFFEEGQEFYIVQELIEGCSLASELLIERRFSPTQVVQMLADLLPVLAFIHSQGVIHRDLKPANILRRQSDQRLVIIDFGIAKKVSTQIADLDPNTKFTIAVGTPGYMPSEQSAGRPQFNSDLYALGMIAIEALTGFPPRSLEQDPATGTILWHELVPQVSPALIALIDQMVYPDCTQRYASASEVLAALATLPTERQPTPGDDWVNQTVQRQGPASLAAQRATSPVLPTGDRATRHDREPIVWSAHTAFLAHPTPKIPNDDQAEAVPAPETPIPDEPSTILLPQPSPLPPPGQPFCPPAPPSEAAKPDADESSTRAAH